MRPRPRRALALLPALGIGMLCGFAIAQRWLPVGLGVGAAVAAGLGAGLYVFRPWARSGRRRVR